MRRGGARPREDQKQDTQKSLEPAQEQDEVVAGGSKNGIDAVTLSALEIVAAHRPLEMADHGLDGGSVPHLAADGFGDTADLAADPDLEPVGIIVATIALVDMDPANSSAGEV